MKTPAIQRETSTFGGDKRAWAAALSALFVELDVIIDEAGKESRPRAERLFFADLELVRTTIVHGAFSVIRSEALVAQSRSNSFFVACVLDGTLTMTQASRSITLGSSDLAVLDSTLPYRINVRGNLDALWVRVPRHRIEGRVGRAAQVLAQRIDGSRGTGHLTSSLLHATLREADHLSGSESLRVSNTLLDLLCLSLEVSESPRDGRSREFLRRIQNYIDDHLADPDLDREQIARRHGISERYLNRIFEREGLSVGRWIRMRRLELSRQLIETREGSGESISAIALACGFNNVSSFNRAFKRHFGTTPSSLRQTDPRGVEAPQA